MEDFTSVLGTFPSLFMNNMFNLWVYYYWVEKCRRGMVIITPPQECFDKIENMGSRSYQQYETRRGGCFICGAENGGEIAEYPLNNKVPLCTVVGFSSILYKSWQKLFEVHHSF